MVQSYVSDVLNGANKSAVTSLFDVTYQDHDPLVIPGVIGQSLTAGGIAHVMDQVDLLNRPGVDLQFVLEEVISDDPTSAAYRLFGEGSLPMDPPTIEASPLGQDGANPEPKARVRKLGVSGTRLQFRVSDTEPASQIMADRIFISYACVGIYHTNGQKFTNRWGAVAIR